MSLVAKSSIAALAAAMLLPTLACAAAAIAAAETKGGVAYYWVGSKKDEKTARAVAQKNCLASAKEQQHTGKCKVALSGNGPAYWAVFHAENGAIGFAGNVDRQAAINRAYEECAKLGSCPDTAAHVWVDDGQPVKTASAPAQNQKCSPPAGKAVRYSDRCTNGDCTRTFENGCTVRFQAAYCFDPLQQRWDWKPNGC